MKNTKAKSNKKNTVSNKKKINSNNMQKKYGKCFKMKKIFKKLLIIYIILLGIFFIWAIDKFFLFYLKEKSPVLGINTECDRMKGLGNLNKADLSNCEKYIVDNEESINKVSINQFGPSVHIFINFIEDITVDEARKITKDQLEVFSKFIKDDKIFEKFEAQLILTKDNLIKLSDAELIVPVEERTTTHPFPQYGVCHSTIGGGEFNIVWAHNGENE